MQIFTLLRNAFKAAGLPLYINAYGVLPTGYERGIIEVVPDTTSRASLGETSDGGLFQLFQSRYGAPGTEAFEAAREAFLVSQAGYAVASFIVQVRYLSPLPLTDCAWLPLPCAFVHSASAPPRGCAAAMR